MPRKRALAETDGNALVGLTRDDIGKRLKSHDAENRTLAQMELIEEIAKKLSSKDINEASSIGTKSSPIDLAEAAPNSNGSKKNRSSTASSSKTSSELEYVTMGRPVFDYKRQYSEDQVQDMWDSTIAPEMKDHHRKPASEHPHWQWIISKPGLELFDKWSYQAQLCDMDGFGMHIYNDYPGYGLQEIIENALVGFQKEYAKKKCDISRLWSHIEGLLWWLHFEPLMDAWAGLDDGARVGDTVCVIGAAILATLVKTERAGLLKDGSIIPNVPLILSMALAWVVEYDDALECGTWEVEATEWPTQLLAFVKKRNIKVEGLYGIDKEVKSVNDTELSQESRILLHDDNFSFVLWHKFVHMYGHEKGGKRTLLAGQWQYDITKMPKAERIRYSFDNTDPMDHVIFE